MGSSPSIVLFRNDLRLADNPALRASIDRAEAVIPVYMHDDSDGAWRPGGAGRWWLHRSLAALDTELRAIGSRLIVQRGDPLKAARALARETQAGAVFWNRRYEPVAIEQDKRVKQALREDGLEVKSFNAALLFEPWTIQTQQRGPYQVFTSFWKACLAGPEPPAPHPRPRGLKPPKYWPTSEPLEALDLLPKYDWAEGLRAEWRPGEQGARARLREFLEDGILDYRTGRDEPARCATSMLSPHLHFGEIGPRQIWREARDREEAGAPPGFTANAEHFLREIGWREFAYHLLFHFPHTTDLALRENFRHFPWESDPAGLRAWQLGQTGYPVVDAGMRQLWRIGWMHNRVRMVVASFLTKHLMIPWQAGAEWFRDTLVDADLANNTLGWQWTAGCGADAAPYFRIFNPILQGEKFDPAGAYVRRWVPELAALPDKFLHRPWEAPSAALAGAGIELGRDYPRPIVDHKLARERALAAYGRIK